MLCFPPFLQYDAFKIGFITTDDFTNADILEATYPAVAQSLHGDWIRDPAIPIVTGFLGKVFPPTNCSGLFVCEINELLVGESLWKASLIYGFFSFIDISNCRAGDLVLLLH